LAVNNDNLATAVAEVSERVSALMREEIELAKAEVTAKLSSLGHGAVAVALGAVFGVFAIVFGLLTLAWGLNSALSSIWMGFAIVFVLLILLAVGAFLFAWRKLKVGAPTPDMALEEARLTRETMSRGIVTRESMTTETVTRETVPPGGDA
jgi:uncharacterized small protein (DUF1192 family)